MQTTPKIILNATIPQSLFYLSITLAKETTAGKSIAGILHLIRGERQFGRARWVGLFWLKDLDADILNQQQVDPLFLCL
jgi:hypothetical protein